MADRMKQCVRSAARVASLLAAFMFGQGASATSCPLPLRSPGEPDSAYQVRKIEFELPQALRGASHVFYGRIEKVDGRVWTGWHDWQVAWVSVERRWLGDPEPKVKLALNGHLRVGDKVLVFARPVSEAELVAVREYARPAKPWPTLSAEGNCGGTAFRLNSELEEQAYFSAMERVGLKE